MPYPDAKAAIRGIMNCGICLIKRDHCASPGRFPVPWSGDAGSFRRRTPQDQEPYPRCGIDSSFSLLGHEIVSRNAQSARASTSCLMPGARMRICPACRSCSCACTWMHSVPSRAWMATLPSAWCSLIFAPASIAMRTSRRSSAL
jgi:hypothetical protein